MVHQKYRDVLLSMDYPDVLTLCDQSKKVTKVCFDDSFWESKLDRDYSGSTILGVRPHSVYLYRYSDNNPIVGDILFNLDYADALLFGEYLANNALTPKALHALYQVLNGRYAVAEGYGMKVGFAPDSVATTIRGELIRRPLGSFRELLNSLSYLSNFPNMKIKIENTPTI